MKTFISIICLSLSLICPCIAGNPPAAIKTAFDQKFEGASNIKWEKESFSEWEATFEWKNAKMSAVYSPDGSLTEVQTEIPIAELPKIVVDAIKKQYRKAEITVARKVEITNKPLQYEADLINAGKVKNVAVDEKGNFVE